MTTFPRRFELTLLPESFAISQLAATAPIPEWATQGPFFSITSTSDELSVVCEQSRVPAGVRSQAGGSVLRVHGPFELTEIGVLSSLASPLAKAKLSLFVVSTLRRITCSLLQRRFQTPSVRSNTQDTSFTGVDQNEKSITKKC